MSRSPEEQEVFDAVYADRMENIERYPKDLTTLTNWVNQLNKSHNTSDINRIITREATIQAYEDEIKRLQLLSLIEN